MIGYVTLGTNRFDEAAVFYDALLGTIAAQRSYEIDTFIAWSAGRSSPAIAVDSPQSVDEFHAKALQLGATDEGAPGARYGNLYVGYFRDLDGNKLNASCVIPE